MKKQNQIRLIIFSLILSGLFGFAVSLYFHHDNSSSNPSDIQLIETFHSPALFVKQLQGDKEAGKKIFKEFCATCHGKPPLIDIHAPLIGDKKIWRAKQAMGINNLLKITISGVGAMPARGGCFECSDQQLLETIQYILNNS